MTGCQERGWSLHFYKWWLHTRTNWTWSWANYCSWRCSKQGFGTIWSPELLSNPTNTIERYLVNFSDPGVIKDVRKGNSIFFKFPKTKKTTRAKECHMQLKLRGELGRKNIIIHAGFLPELKTNQKVSERPEQIDLITLALLRSTSKWKALSWVYRTDTWCVQKGL